HPQRRGAEQAALRCHHRPGRCPPQHPGRPPAQEDREDRISYHLSSHIYYHIIKRPFSGPPFLCESSTLPLFSLYLISSINYDLFLNSSVILLLSKVHCNANQNTCTVASTVCNSCQVMTTFSFLMDRICQ